MSTIYSQLSQLYKHVICYGESAGANLCAVLALKLRDEAANAKTAEARTRHPLQATILLVPPVTNSAHRSTLQSGLQFDEYGVGIDKGVTSRAEYEYLYDKFNSSDPYQFPLRDPLELQGFPPTLLVTAEYDILKSEELLFLEKLKKRNQKLNIYMYKQCTCT